MANNNVNKSNDIPQIGIGVIGCGVIAESHIDGILRMPYMFGSAPGKPELVKICEIDEKKAKEVSGRYGFLEYCTDWNELIADERIRIIYVTAPNNLHKEICIAAAKKGKNIVCEKPLALNAAEAKEMMQAAEKEKIKHLCNFVFRMVPALAFARKLITDKKLGRILSFNASRLIDHLIDPETPSTWRLKKEISGSGVVGDLLSHIIDLARWFCGEPTSVMAVNKIFFKERPSSADISKKEKIHVEDDSIAIMEFENGASGYLSASGVRAGRKTFGEVEINGELGSIYWNFGEMNRLNVYFRSEESEKTQGFHVIEITGDNYPYFDKWHFPGFLIGFNDLFMNTAYNIVNSVINNTSLEHSSATFKDGYRTAVVCDAILESSKSEKKEKIIF